MSSTIGIRPPRFYGKLFIAFELFGDLCCSQLELRETWNAMTERKWVYQKDDIGYLPAHSSTHRTRCARHEATPKNDPRDGSNQAF